MPIESLAYPSDAASRAGTQRSISSKKSPEKKKTHVNTARSTGKVAHPGNIALAPKSHYETSSKMSFAGGPHDDKMVGTSGVTGHPKSYIPPPAYTETAPGPSILGCPAGLECLVNLDQLLIGRSVQKYKEHINMFQVNNSAGQPIFFALEETNPRQQQCCPKKRGFTMHLTNNYGQEVIQAVRDFKCCAGCCWCACCDSGAYEMFVEAPVGNVIGSVRQACTWMTNDFKVLDADRQSVLTIMGPSMAIRPSPGMNIECRVLGLDGSAVGSITRLGFGPFSTARPYTDELHVAFPLDLDVKMKACILNAAFLLNLIFFERFIYIR